MDCIASSYCCFQNAISGKLTAADIANLAPKESAELVASLQARVAALEGW